ncbi:MAG: esterase/lipase family protein [Synechococcus sp.]
MKTIDPAAISAGQPVLILGGFLITDEAYAVMASRIQALSGGQVEIVPMSRLDWLRTSAASGWTRCLDRVDAMARRLQAGSSTGRITLIGHSSGGVMLRPYLSEQPFLGRRYGGSRWCNRLITLGSPHQAQRATPLRAQVDQDCPGCPWADQVDAIAVAGVLDLSSATASWVSRRSADRSYRQINGPGEWRGDGLVPVESALLRDARPITVADTAHGGLFGSSWYGSADRVDQWWTAACR